MNIKNRNIAVIGAKRSGLALLNLIRRHEGIARISDAAPWEEWPEDLKEVIAENRITCEAGTNSPGFLDGADILVISPGVRRDAPVVKYAEAAGICVLGEVEFAFQFCERPVIAITGSNGKTTVTTLTGRVLEAAGKTVSVCGNIGRPFSAHVLDSVDVFVLEVSSFQMESLISPDHPCQKKGNKISIKGFKPNVAVLLNFSQNHLDRHRDLEEYWDAKTRIFLNQTHDDFAVIHRDLMDRCSDVQRKGIVSRVFPTVDQPSFCKNPNFSAVREIARIFSVSDDVTQNACEHFLGVEHRLEMVRVISGVTYINDSKSTTVESGRWALARMEAPVWMICGGRDKNSDFTPLAGFSDVRKKVRAVLAIGEAKDKIAASFRPHVPVILCDSLEDAVGIAQREANPGDCVLLSPMCASFDMFKDYEDRGKVFKTIVQELKEVTV